VSWLIHMIRLFHLFVPWLVKQVGTHSTWWVMSRINDATHGLTWILSHCLFKRRVTNTWKRGQFNESCHKHVTSKCNTGSDAFNRQCAHMGCDAFTWYDAFTYSMTHLYMSWLSHDSFMTHSWLIHDSFMTHSYICDVMTWLIHVWCDSFICGRTHL